MNYIYDILVNFEDKIYEFYEWSNKDNIKHLKKIPIFKVNNKVMDDLYFNNIKVNDDFLNIILNESEYYNFEKVKYISIFTDGEKTLVINFNDEGNTLYKSKLLLEEEEEVNEFSLKLQIFNLDYKIIGKNKIKYNYLTRKEENIKNILLNNLNDTYKYKDYNKISYMYFECYNKKDKSIDVMYNRLLDSINNNFRKVHSNLYKLLLIEMGK